MDNIMQTISATDLARQTRIILDRITTQGETIAVERNHTLIAKIIPSERHMTATQAIAALELPILTPVQASAWLRDSQAEFEERVSNPWV